MNSQETNPKDYQVVSFHNSTSFRFTPEMGCMYNGRAINDDSGEPGIGSGITRTLPYHIGHQLAVNLAKAVVVKGAPSIDAKDAPQGVSLWSEDSLEKIKNSFIKELYSEERPTPMSQADLLISKISELNALKDKLEAKLGEPTVTSSQSPEYQDKADVIQELNKREIKFDARKSKSELEKLLA